MKIGIFGGTFDPPHRGHRAAAAAALKQLELDGLLVIPASKPPHKAPSEAGPGPYERLRLTEICMAGLEGLFVSDMELRRGGVSYTADTVRELAARYRGAKLFLLLGTDQLLAFEQWRDFEYILGEVTLAVCTRREEDTRRLRYAADELSRRYNAKIRFLLHEEVPISSTDLRDLLPLRRGREYLEEDVYREILRRGYYRARPDYGWLRERAYEMLTPSRVAHVQGCEETAVALARRWGADEDRAREAAILHDITKKDNLKTQLHLCGKYGIIPDEMEKTEGKLLHSKTGAAIAQYEFGCDSEVFEAIYWHTTGRENMALLDKVMYMADYIEPNRNFPGVDELREAAFSDIDKALLMGFQMSVDDMTSRGVKLHPRTVGALQWIKDKSVDKG